MDTRNMIDLKEGTEILNSFTCGPVLLILLVVVPLLYFVLKYGQEKNETKEK